MGRLWQSSRPLPCNTNMAHTAGKSCRSLKECEATGRGCAPACEAAPGLSLAEPRYWARLELPGRLGRHLWTLSLALQGRTDWRLLGPGRLS